MSGQTWEYAAIFCGAAVLSLALTPLALRLALRLAVFDRPAENKGHRSPVPYLGGLAIVTSFALAVVAASVVHPPTSGSRELVVVLTIGLALSVVGLIDDLRGLGPWFRLFFELSAAVALWAAGVSVELFPLEAANLAFTLVWVIGVTNAFNLLDNMDGLSAGVAAIGAFWFFVIGSAHDQFLVAGLSIALVGCALGFLRHNFHPARIYMGDAGSLFLGFMLSYLGLKLRFDGPTSVTFLVPILVLTVAVVDTTLVSMSRIWNGRSPFQGGLDHMSHRLVFVGIPVRGAVIVIYGMAVSTGLIALVISRIDRVSAYLLAGLVLAGAILLGILLSRVPVYRGRDVWAQVDAERAAELVDAIEYEEAAGRPIRNRQARLGSLFERKDDL